MTAERHGRSPASCGSCRLCRLVAAAVVVVLAALWSGALSSSVAAASPLPRIRAVLLRQLTAGMTGPTDVAIGPSDQAYVLDGVNGRVVVFDSGGRRVKTLTGFAGGGSMATGLDVDSQGRVYVADPARHRVAVLSAAGALQRTWSFPSGPAGAADPTDVILAEPEGRAIVVDNDNQRIHVVDLGSGSVTRTVGSEGQGRGRFRYPFLGSYDDERHEALIVESVNTRVQVFDSNGTARRSFGSFGVNRGQFFRPKDVAVDSWGRAWVSDGYLGVIQAFDERGNFLGALADGSSGALVKLTTPTGMAIDSLGRLYVVESMAGRVRVYSLAGED